MLSTWLRRYAEKDGRGYPDWAMRYTPIVHKLHAKLSIGGTIVEIGANANGFARFAHVPVVAVDLELANLREARAAQPVYAVVADASALPFPTGGVALCVCVDTLEHIPPASREAVLHEIVRILTPQGTAVIAFPSGTAARQAEKEIQAAYHRLTGRTLPWLEQHQAFGLPDTEAVQTTLAACAHVEVEYNTPVCVWRWIWRILLCGWPGRGNALFQVLLRLAVPGLLYIRGAVNYRVVMWVRPQRPGEQEHPCGE